MNILHKRGKTRAVNAYTGPQGEIVINTDENTILVQDGKTAGGTILAKRSDIPTKTSQLQNDSGFSTSGGIASTGNRGSLAGYETYVSGNGESPTINVSATSPDYVYISNIGDS